MGNPYKSMTIFVTGPSGFIGSNLLKRLTKDGKTVIALFRNPPDNRAYQTGYGLGDVHSPNASVQGHQKGNLRWL